MIGPKVLTKENFPLLMLAAAVVCLPFSRTACHSFLVVLLANWVLSGNWSERFQQVKSELPLITLSIFIVYFIAGLAYSEEVTNVRATFERKFFFFTIPFVIATTAIFETEKARTFLLRSFVVACLAAAAFAYLQAVHNYYLFLIGDRDLSGMLYLNSDVQPQIYAGEKTGWLFFSYIGLANGMSLHPTYFSLFLGAAALFLLREILTKTISTSWLVLHIIAIATLFITILLLSSKVIIVILSILTVGALVMQLNAGRKQTAFWLGGGLIVLSSLIWFNPVTHYRSIEEIFLTNINIAPHHHYRKSTEIRASLWWLAWTTYKNGNPIVGAGSADVPTKMRSTAEKVGITNVMGTYDPHNEFLYLSIGNGILGVLLLAAYLFFCGRVLWTSRDWLGVSWLILFIGLMFTESALELQKGIVFFAIFISMFVTRATAESHSRNYADLSGAVN